MRRIPTRTELLKVRPTEARVYGRKCTPISRPVWRATLQDRSSVPFIRRDTSSTTGSGSSRLTRAPIAEMLCNVQGKGRRPVRVTMYARCKTGLLGACRLSFMYVRHGLEVSKKRTIRSH